MARGRQDHERLAGSAHFQALLQAASSTGATARSPADMQPGAPDGARAGSDPGRTEMHD
jgi:hypothetical protein